MAFLIVILWGVCNNFIYFSENWQLDTNTSTAIITFIMDNIIQHSQNKEGYSDKIK